MVQMSWAWARDENGRAVLRATWTTTVTPHDQRLAS